VHDKRFHYLRNFRPELPWAQFMSYVDQHPSMRAWQKLHDEGKLSGPPAMFFETKPAEELYDVTVDRWETKNLASDPQYAADLKRLREECEAWMLRTGDLGLLPEYELHKRAADSTPYEIATDPKKNPLRELLDAARHANARNAKESSAVDAAAESKDPALRYRGALGMASQPEFAALSNYIHSNDLEASPDAFVVQAETLANSKGRKEGLRQLRAALEHESPFIRLAALNALGRMGAYAQQAIPDIKQATLKSAEHPDAAEYVGRMVDYLPQRIRAAAEKQGAAK